MTELNAKHFQGNPCLRGHSGIRYKSTGATRKKVRSAPGADSAMKLFTTNQGGGLGHEALPPSPAHRAH